MRKQAILLISTPVIAHDRDPLSWFLWARVLIKKKIISSCRRKEKKWKKIARNTVISKSQKSYG